MGNIKADLLYAQNGLLTGEGSNSKTLFLPAAGFRSGTSLLKAGERGYYWSSSLEEGHSDSAWCVYFNSGGASRYGNNISRYLGFSVRPVTE